MKWIIGRIKSILQYNSLIPTIVSIAAVDILGNEAALGSDSGLRTAKFLDPFIIATKENPWENSLGMRFVVISNINALFCIWETRLKDFEKFVADTKHDAGNEIFVLGEMKWELKKGHNWRNPGFSQGLNQPVVGVSWYDATSFCRWLTKKERDAGRIKQGQKYRLPTDKEWSIAAGGGKYVWGDAWPPPRGVGNFAGREVRMGGDGPKSGQLLKSIMTNLRERRPLEALHPTSMVYTI